MPVRNDETENEWIVCLGETRSSAGAVVACPRLGGEAVALGECWECHLLMWRGGERDLPDPCSTEPTHEEVTR